jgi:hypothetical protein
MKMNSNYAKITVLFLVCALSSITATLKPVYFRTFGLDIELDNLYYKAPAKAGKTESLVNISIYESGKSIFYEMDRDKKLELGTLIKDEKGKDIFQLSESVDVKKYGVSPLLIFTKNPDNENGFSVDILPNDIKSFPPSSCLVINYTAAEIYTSIDGEIQKTAPNSKQVFKVKNLGGEIPISIKMAAMRGEKSALIYASNWGLTPLHRVIMVITNKNNRPRVKRILDTVEMLPNDLQKITADE